MVNKIRPRRTLDDATQLEIARGLFPGVGPTDWEHPRTSAVTPPPFGEEELREAVKRLKTGKAAGPDNIPPEIARVTACEQAETFLKITNNMITSGVFPQEWKETRLVLIEKPRKNPTAAPTYRPICLINTLGKIAEGMICNRINLELEEGVGLSPNQFGFRKGKCTIDAMKEVVNCRQKGTRLRNTRGFCVLVTLDIRNAFNSASWTKIIKAMSDKGISPYLVEIIKSYLKGRYIRVGKEAKLEMTCGVPQGSKLGPLLWNIMYDGVFSIELPQGATTIGFADDIGIVVTAWTEDELRLKTNMAIDITINWLRRQGLQVAPEKTEAVILAGRRTLLRMDIIVQNRVVETSECIKYLGVYFDKDLKMRQHIIQTAKKAGEAIRNLSRLMPNTGGPSSTKRRVLGTVVNSILLYSAPIWDETLKLAKYRLIYERVQRQMAISICSAYRTVSTVAAQLLSGQIPIDLLATERARTFHATEEEARRIKEDTLDAWQARWTSETRGAWTRRLIPNVRVWIERTHGVLDFHLTQLLSGHGSFETYLCGIGRRDTPTCPHCHRGDDDVEHTFFLCTKWMECRTAAWSQLGGNVTPENIVAKMIGDEENWKTVKELANQIMRAKEQAEKDLEERRRLL